MYVVTGASRGIGQFLFERLLADGEEAVGTFFHTPPSGPNASKLHKVDVSDHAQVFSFIAGLRSQLQRVVLINCAGTNYNAFGHKSDMDKWAEVINVNLLGSFHLIAALLPVMREQSYGRVINLSSVVAQTPVPGTSAYAASKAGLWGMTRALAAENAKKGITVNTLNLGYFNIGMITEVPAEFQPVVKAKIPTGEFGDPENIYRTVKFVVGNDYLNGASIDVSAGMV
jgi:NAD(P)-dependent dehydrogenase (short-subunit alcohol dehydrogenase family)